jgi:hypothetical protein
MSVALISAVAFILEVRATVTDRRYKNCALFDEHRIHLIFSARDFGEVAEWLKAELC